MSGLKYFLMGVTAGVVGVGVAALVSDKLSEKEISYTSFSDADDEKEELYDDVVAIRTEEA